MGFSGWFFSRVLFVCCLVWGSGVESPRNVGLSNPEGLSGAEEGRHQKKWMWGQGGFQTSRVRDLVARTILVWPHPIGSGISERRICCNG